MLIKLTHMKNKNEKTIPSQKFIAGKYEHFFSTIKASVYSQTLIFKVENRTEFKQYLKKYCDLNNLVFNCVYLNPRQDSLRFTTIGLFDVKFIKQAKNVDYRLITDLKTIKEINSMPDYAKVKALVKLLNCKGKSIIIDVQNRLQFERYVKMLTIGNKHEGILPLFQDVKLLVQGNSYLDANKVRVERL